MNSRWQANKIGLINFWYYDEQEFPFVKGRMLLRGSNGSGKSVTMQSVVPLLLDGNMSPERLDPFGSRDRKMSSYLLEENDGREERTGYLYLEFKRKDSETYLTIGMGIRARKGKPLDKWYFSLTDGRRIGKDFFLYKETGEKITLSKKELENRIGDGGRVIDRQADYMEYVNRQIFGFDTPEEYKEMIDLLIQLRTPKLSKDFKPSVINDILSDSLQPLSDEDLRPMSEAIENMDAMNMNLKSRREAHQAAEKINTVLKKYNQKMLYDKAVRLEQAKSKLEEAQAAEKEHEKRKNLCCQKTEELESELQQLDAKHESMEKERESLSKSDAVSLKNREAALVQEIEKHERDLIEKNQFLEKKQEQYQDVESQIKAEEDRKYEKEKEMNELLEEMSSEAETMAFEEHVFMQEELLKKQEEHYRFDLHQQQFEHTREQISKGLDILSETKELEQKKDEFVQKRDQQISRMDSVQRKISELESVLVQVENEWKEALYQWNGNNQELALDKELLRELSNFADSYGENSDFATVRQKVADVWIYMKTKLEAALEKSKLEEETYQIEKTEVQNELTAWENQKEPEPPRSEAVLRNRQRLEAMNIPYQEFYKVIEFGQELDETACSRLEEALLRMGILDAIIVDEQYKEQVLQWEKGCEDRYLFAGNKHAEKSLLDILELNEELNDIFSSQRLTKILGNIAYDTESEMTIQPDGTYRMGVLTGTVTGEYEPGFLGQKARERQRLAKIEDCKQKLCELEERIQQCEKEKQNLVERKNILAKEYENLPTDTDMREALLMLREQANELKLLKNENNRLEEELKQLIEVLKEKKKQVLVIAEALYLECSYSVFRDAKAAAEEYGKHLIRLKAVHEMMLTCMEYLSASKERLEDLDADMDQIRYDITSLQREIARKTEEKRSIEEQLSLTDYEEIKSRLDECISWLRAYPDKLQETVRRKTQTQEEIKQIAEKLEEDRKKIQVYEEKTKYYLKCYEAEYNLGYVELPDELSKDLSHIRAYLETEGKNLHKDTIINNLNSAYFENRGFLVDYQLMQNELFEDLEEEKSDEFTPKRLDISARYQGVKISFASLIEHLEEDIRELENLIKDGDRELFEDILANTVSRKIRGKINSSVTWVQKMNSLMNGMNTSSGLKLSLRWRSKTAEQEDQLDTKELVELLKKDYRLMSEEEASRLSAHFRSKVDEARRNARDSAGMVSFYQIMKDALDYRKWFEFQLFCQKSGERQKELTNSVFGTFSGGEKAMSMYVPLFSAVVAKYQGGRGDAPRLISLDEAFAGVDNKNIRDMFRLMTEFQFDFIINSQVLWGDCDTLDALAIYQLIRPQNAKFVTVMPYLWNGHMKELMEDEENVEKRGIELEQEV